MNGSNISEIIASCPEPNKKSSVFLREPVAYDCDEAWKQKCIEYSDEDLYKIIVRLVCPIEKTWEGKQCEEYCEATKGYSEHNTKIIRISNDTTDVQAYCIEEKLCRIEPREYLLSYLSIALFNDVVFAETPKLSLEVN